MSNQTETEIPQLQKSLAQTKEQVKLAELFLIKYCSKLPDGMGTLSIGQNSFTYAVNLGYKTEDDRNKALTIMGDVFGRADWVAKITYNRDGYDWSKKLDGCSLYIFEAQKLSAPQDFPVNPTQFPIQLTDAIN
jgi:hypothetical protein